MHPGLVAWWHAHRRASCDDGVECGSFAGPGGFGGHRGFPGRHGGRHGPQDHGDGHGHGPGEGHGHGHGGGEGHGDDFGFGGFGVRRPLRFLAFKLELDDGQVTELATVLNELKTERAQAAVDHRRTTSALADAVASETFDEAKAKAASDERVRSTERLEGAVARAIGRIHSLLKAEQRAKFAYLLRTGALSM
jgi:hypothetical protein